VCTPPVAYFRLFCVLYVCTTYQPCGPHLIDVTRVCTSPRRLALHDFSDQGATPSPSETLIHDVARRQISWLSFLLDRCFRLNHDFVIRGFEVQRTLPPSSRYPSSRNGPTSLFHDLVTQGFGRQDLCPSSLRYPRSRCGPMVQIFHLVNDQD
jgi:hypothetical protein